MWNEQSDQGGKWKMKSYIVAGYIRRFERFESSSIREVRFISSFRRERVFYLLLTRIWISYKLKRYILRCYLSILD